MVKEELNSEEKFFEKAVITEKFVKKYKNLLIGSVIAIVVVVGGNIIYDMKKDSTASAANKTLAKLEQNSNDKTALLKLKSLSPKIHDLWLYSQAITNQNVGELKILQTSKTPIVDDLAKYEYAQATNNLSAIKAYSTTEHAIYKDLATVQSAVILMRSNKIAQAHDILSTITANSPLAKVAHALMHYGVK